MDKGRGFKDTMKRKLLRLQYYLVVMNLHLKNYRSLEKFKVSCYLVLYYLCKIAGGYVLQFGWNTIISNTLSVSEISIWQAFGFYVLLRYLFSVRKPDFKRVEDLYFFVNSQVRSLLFTVVVLWVLSWVL